MSLLEYPPWVILHIPHDSYVIPADVRSQFLLSDAELEQELQCMTDHLTHTIFAEPLSESMVVRAPVSRLVVDVERFAEDEHEPMAARGMGAIYGVTSHLRPLRRRLSPNEREMLMQTWYHPHHQRLEAVVSDTLDRYGRCLVIDGHSFPGTALPYENAIPTIARPDICIGSDPFHTPKVLEQSFVEVFGRKGWKIKVNEPFAGALVPASRYQRDPRVMAVMVEVNRDLYLIPDSFQQKSDFARVASAIKSCCALAISKFMN
jgi:N-formylglutamate amidohydrolase